MSEPSKVKKSKTTVAAASDVKKTETTTAAAAGTSGIMEEEGLEDTVKCLQALKELDLKRIVTQLSVLKKMMSELNLFRVEHHFAQVGEAARVIQDAYKGKRRAPIDGENSSPNKVAKLPVRKTGDDAQKPIPKPKICSFILESDFCKARPTYSSHDTYIDNMTHVRNAINHRAKHENAVTLREKYEVLEEALGNLNDDERENIISSLDSESKKLAPSSACPTLEEIKLMKPYFCRRSRVVDHQ